jgi:signal transduction histidine kinase/DNA-binding response OmpR family regulator
MANPRDRILLVESDPTLSDLIGRQALQSTGYQVQVATDASAAISRALQWSPDLIIIDLHLPGLSGKDLMVALASQGVRTPLIVLARRGSEADLIQTFRLGAADYLLLPAREAEVINAVSRVLQQVHDRRERDRLAAQLQQTNQELQSRVRELTTIFALGKAMTSITDTSLLLEKILDGAVRITQADLGWFLLREDTDRPFLVAAQNRLPDGLGVRAGQPWDDGISSLVAMSGEPLAIHGDPLRRFKIAALGMAALIVPIKAQKKVVGLLAMMRRQANAFSPSDQNLLSALADYASISLINARLFRAVEERARSLQRAADGAQLNEKVNNEILRQVDKEISAPLLAAQSFLEGLANDPLLSRWRPDQRGQLSGAQNAVAQALDAVRVVSPREIPKNGGERAANLTELAQASLRRLQPFASRLGVQIVAALPNQPLLAAVDGALTARVVDALLSNAIKFSPKGGQVVFRLERTPEGAHLVARSPGRAMDEKEIEAAFSASAIASTSKSPGASGPSGGPGIRLHLAREIVQRMNGKLWLESQDGQGNDVHLRLPLTR